MPYKANKPYRKKFKKAKYRVKNWKFYNEALRKRGAITVWLDDASWCAWYSTEAATRGRPQYYSDAAIQCCLILRQVYHLPLRQTQGFVWSLTGLMALDLDVPDYSTLSKRGISLEMARLIDTIKPGSHVIIDSTGLKVYGKDEWHQEKHDVQAKRTWRKLHIAVDEKHQIVVCELTDKSVGDPTAAQDLLTQIDHANKVIADGAYDTHGLYTAVRAINADADIVIPPGNDAVVSDASEPQRNQHIQTLKERSRIGWQQFTDYGKQA